MPLFPSPSLKGINILGSPEFCYCTLSGDPELFQPGGLSESSRWSKRSEDHRYRLTNLIARRRGATCNNRREVFVVRDWDLAPLRGAISYYLLQVSKRPLKGRRETKYFDLTNYLDFL